MADPVPSAPSVRAESFQGQVSRPGLLDILDTCRDLALSGMLRVQGAGGTADIHLEDGRLRSATMAGFTGTAALTRAIMLETAEFSLVPATQRPPRNIHQDGSFVLASIAKVLVDAGIQLPPRRTSETSGVRGGPPKVGATLGRCRLVTEFGRGASSRVYLAWHQTLKIDVVVKVLLPSGEGSPHALLLTANEAQVLARLSHPAIMRLYDFDDSGAFPLLVMEYIDGQNLTRLIKDRGRLTPNAIIPLIAQVAEGLAYACETTGVIHCDIKPDNLLLDKAGRVRIADFGLAGVPGTGESGLHSQLVKQGVVIGTPAYIAPELVEGGVAKADQRSDIYSLGATLYQTLTGQPPFIDNDPIQLMVKRLKEMPVPPHVAVPECDRLLSDLAMRMLAPDPSARPQSHREVLDALGEIEAALHQNVIRRRTSFWQYFRNEDGAAGG